MAAWWREIPADRESWPGTGRLAFKILDMGKLVSEVQGCCEESFLLGKCWPWMGEGPACHLSEHSSCVVNTCTPYLFRM